MKLHLTYEFESEDELRAHLGAETENRAAPAVVVTPVTDEADADVDTDGPTRNDTDADGMPYDEEIHSDPPQFTADGLWRARRGKADEAKAARAAFKAGGGDFEGPAELPGMELPGLELPGLPASAPEPVSLDRMIEKINVMLTRNLIDSPTLESLYEKHSGVSAKEAFGVFQTNETARANLVAALVTIEGL